MNTQPGRLLTEQELREWEHAWRLGIKLRNEWRRKVWLKRMKQARVAERDMDLCVCGHPESEHTTIGTCAIHRRDRGPECGCLSFKEKNA